MNVKRKQVTSYMWNEKAILDLMVKDMKDKFGIVISPHQIIRAKIGHTTELVQYGYVVVNEEQGNGEAGS